MRVNSVFKNVVTSIYNGQSCGHLSVVFTTTIPMQISALLRDGLFMFSVTVFFFWNHVSWRLLQLLLGCCLLNVSVVCRMFLFSVSSCLLSISLTSLCQLEVLLHWAEARCIHGVYWWWFDREFPRSEPWQNARSGSGSTGKKIYLSYLLFYFLLFSLPWASKAWFISLPIIFGALLLLASV